MDVVQSIVATLQGLPPEKQKEVLDFAEFLRAKSNNGVNDEKHPRRSLKGLWAGKGIEITEQDIAEIRREMWKDFPREDI